MQRIGQNLATQHDIQVLWELGRDRKEQVIGKAGLVWGGVGKRSIPRRSLVNLRN